MAMNVDAAHGGWIEVGNDSRLTGFDGCLEFSAPVEVSDGSVGGPVEGDGEIQFGEVISEDCEEPSAYSDAFNALFDTNDAVYTIDGPRLTLLNSEGNGVTLRTNE